jgi:hypothetical protein
MMQVEIAQKTARWGISVSSVEIRDVVIPVALQDAMSRQAQAEREKPGARDSRISRGCDLQASSSRPPISTPGIPWRCNFER